MVSFCRLSPYDHYHSVFTDLEALVKAVEFTRILAETDPLAHIFQGPNMPPPNVTTDEIREYICRMIAVSTFIIDKLSFIVLSRLLTQWARLQWLLKSLAEW